MISNTTISEYEPNDTKTIKIYRPNNIIRGIPRQIDTAKCQINTLHLGFLRNFVKGVIGGPEHACASFSSLRLMVFAL